MSLLLYAGGFVLTSPFAVATGLVHHRSLWSRSVAFHDKGIDVQHGKRCFVLPWSDIQALSITGGKDIWSHRWPRWLVARSASHITDPEQDPRAPLEITKDGRWRLLPLDGLKTVKDGERVDASEQDIISAIQHTAPARLHDVS